MKSRPGTAHTASDLLYVVRHAASVLALPFTVTVLVPLWIARRASVTVTWPASWLEWLLAIAALASLVVGLILFVWTLRLFFTQGRGTLAPWDPPRRLVVTGPYRHVRNPMITGVLFLVLAEALFLRSWPHAQWCALFGAMNAIYLPLIEEPGLEQRFGEDYTLYRRHVPRFVPRVSPWRED
jgi:protein-S-isoprenylcysteine O-methyltransferase Ste14